MGKRRIRQKGRQTRQNEHRTRQTENAELVKFIIENQGKEYGPFEIFVRGANAVPTRTPHSLYQHFHKYIAGGITNAAKLTDQQVLQLAKQFRIKLNDSVIKELGEDFIVVRDEQGLIDKFGIHPETLAVQFNQLHLAQEAEVRGPDAGSNALFEVIALLIGSLEPKDVNYDTIHNVFDRLIEMYWHAEALPTVSSFRRVTQEHLGATVQAFLSNFNAPIQQENEATVAFKGEKLRHLRIVHDSLEDPAITEQQLLGAIATASNGQIDGWRNGNKIYPDFNFPTTRIKEIIKTIFSALQQEGSDV